MSAQWDDAALAFLLDDPDGPVGQDLARRVTNGANDAGRRAPIGDTGRLAGSIESEVEVDDEGLVGRWGSNVSYAAEVEKGTGLFGPEHRRIVPTEKQALAFTYQGHHVVVKSIAGAHAQPYLRPSLDAAAE